ncbi:hypothetical protein PsorP6_003114 [Peronosclerospora sorghi]|uniref:Uncharacterized protein n=1 Tax=Peronosclerospora sorghi TaxID=230839 RepID=A0ACC0VQT4_9STRA|nr:hypothetical protein PsorP6_003114 [Peronosclerospora sorghi]
MFSSWELVRPRFWYPMSALEQSMMELEHMSDLMSRSRFPFDMGSRMLASPSNIDDDDFFRDLPVLARERKPATVHREADAQSTEKTKPSTSSARDNDSNKMTKEDGDNGDNHYRRAFSSYSFSDSSIVDDKGRRVTSTRRRYEDSTGRLKAVHERQVEGKKLRTTWNRMSHDDEGKQEATCSSGTPEEFEALWQQTPFCEAQTKTIKEQQQPQPQQEQQQQLEHEQQKEQQTVTSNSSIESEATPMEA